MSFVSPLALLVLLAIPLALFAHVAAGRRRRRYPVRFPALGTLESGRLLTIATTLGRSLLILIPAAAFVPSRALGTFPVIVSAIVPSEGVATERKAVARGRETAPRPMRVFTAHDLLGEPTQCDYTGKGNTSISRNSDDENDTWRAHISAGDCDLTIRTIGKVRFASDLSDVQSVPPNGSFLLTESDALTTRRIEIRSDASGRMTRSGCCSPAILWKRSSSKISRVRPKAKRHSFSVAPCAAIVIRPTICRWLEV